MSLVLAQARMEFKPHSTIIEWDWTDYVGVSLLALAIAFIALAFAANRAGVSPLALMDRFAKVIGLALGKKP